MNQEDRQEQSASGGCQYTYQWFDILSNSYVQKAFVGTTSSEINLVTSYIWVLAAHTVASPSVGKESIDIPVKIKKLRKKSDWSKGKKENRSLYNELQDYLSSTGQLRGEGSQTMCLPLGSDTSDVINTAKKSTMYRDLYTRMETALQTIKNQFLDDDSWIEYGVSGTLKPGAVRFPLSYREGTFHGQHVLPNAVPGVFGPASRVWEVHLDTVLQPLYSPNRQPSRNLVTGVLQDIEAQALIALRDVAVENSVGKKHNIITVYTWNILAELLSKNQLQRHRWECLKWSSRWTTIKEILEVCIKETPFPLLYLQEVQESNVESWNHRYPLQKFLEELGMECFFAADMRRDSAPPVQLYKKMHADNLSRYSTMPQYSSPEHVNRQSNLLSLNRDTFTKSLHTSVWSTLDKNLHTKSILLAWDTKIWSLVGECERAAVFCHFRDFCQSHHAVQAYQRIHPTGVDVDQWEQQWHRCVTFTGEAQSSPIVALELKQGGKHMGTVMIVASIHLPVPEPQEKQTTQLLQCRLVLNEIEAMIDRLVQSRKYSRDDIGM